MSTTPKLLASYAESEQTSSHVDPCVIEDWENDFSDIVTSVEITDSTVIVNNSIIVEFGSDRESAEKFVLYLLGKPKIK